MKEIQLLDCTLRDGGFINNWEFGKDCIINIVDRLAVANIEIIEVGFLRDIKKYDIEKSEFRRLSDVKNVVNSTYNNSMIVAIIEFSTYDISFIESLEDAYPISGLRLMFRKPEIEEAMIYAKKLKDMGYKVFLQPVNIMDYSSEDRISLVKKANELEPYAFYIVDTYGFMYPSDLIKAFYLIDANLNENIKIGYHSHNNFQLAYANCMELIKLQTKRDIILDVSVFGMGKGAGNANAELIALYLNDIHNKSYNLDQILEIADIYITKEREKNFWGYTLLYYIAAAVRVHHMYVKYLLDKKTLSVSAIKYILQNLDEDKKTTFHKEYIQDVYHNYQSIHINDKLSYKRLTEMLNGHNILLIGLGASVYDDKNLVDEYILKNKPIIISLNHIPEYFETNYIFVGNAKRYSQLMYKFKAHNIDKPCPIIATSNITQSSLNIDYWFNYADLQSNENVDSDSSGIMLIQALINMGIKHVALAGFDGFSNNKPNFYDKSYELEFKDENKALLFDRRLKQLSKEIQLEFITRTTYEFKQEI